MNYPIAALVASSVLLAASVNARDLTEEFFASNERDNSHIVERAATPSQQVTATSQDMETSRAFAQRADAVFSGKVVDIFHQISEPDSKGQQLPFTVVTWYVDDGIKGVATGQTYSARFLGGPLGEKTLEVSEIPNFELGDRDLLFIDGNGERGCPLVDGARGRVQLDAAAGKSSANVSEAWRQQIAQSIRSAGLDGGVIKAPALDKPFVFELPKRVTRDQMRAAHARALARIDTVLPR